MKDILFQIKLKNCKGYDILKCVYKNVETDEINIVEVVKEEKEFNGKDDYMDKVFTDYINDFEVQDGKEITFLCSKYKIPPVCTVYYSSKRNRLCTFVENK